LSSKPCTIRGAGFFYPLSIKAGIFFRDRIRTHYNKPYGAILGEYDAEFHPDAKHNPVKKGSFLFFVRLKEPDCSG